MAKANDLKRENIYLVRKCLFDGKIWTKNEVSKATGLSIAGARNVLRWLCKVGEIEVCGLADSQKGRKSKQYIIVPRKHSIGRIVLINHITHCTVLCSAVSLTGEVLFSFEESFESISEKEITDCMNRLCGAVESIEVLTVSIPGVCVNGIIEISGIESLRGVHLAEILKVHKEIPCIIENDVNVACIGFQHSHSENQNVAMIYQTESGNYGCGFIINGRLYNGASHYAGEISGIPLEKGLDKTPQDYLKDRIVMLACTLNPSVIAWHSDLFGDEKLDFSSYGLPEKLIPQTEEIKDFYSSVQTGLYEIGQEILLSMDIQKAAEET